MNYIILFELYNIWEEQLKLRYENYYLRIWLYHPSFFESQLVAAIEDRIEYYENIFQQAENELNVPKIYKIKEFKKYNWKTFIGQYEASKNSDELDEEQIKWWENNATEIIHKDSETLYRRNYGNLWINKST